MRKQISRQTHRYLQRYIRPEPPKLPPLERLKSLHQRITDQIEVSRLKIASMEAGPEQAEMLLIWLTLDNRREDVALQIDALVARQTKGKEQTDGIDQ